MVVQIPKKLKAPSAIGFIIANYYFIEVKVRTSGCSGNGYGNLHLMVLPNYQPSNKLIINETLPPSWNPTQFPLVSNLNMKPYFNISMIDIPYKNVLGLTGSIGIPPKFSEED